MIQKFTIIIDNKFILNNFSINKYENYIEIKNIDNNIINNILNIPIFNKFNISS